MKIIYIHQHFVTREGSAGTRSYDVSAHLVKMGHEVTIICGMHDQSALEPMPWWRMCRTHHFEGFKVICCNVPYSNKMSIAARLWTIFGFVWLATWAALWERRADVVFATSPPLEVSIPAFVASRLKRVPFVFEVRDLWPEDIVDAGRIKRGGLGHRLQSFLEWFAYRLAAKVTVVSKGFYDRLIERGYPADFLTTILLGAEGDMFKEVSPDREYLRQQGLEGKCVAIYAGAHGTANGLVQVLDAAEHLRDRDDIGILFVGDGKQRDDLLRDIERRGLRNVRMPGPVPKVELPNILAACDVGLQILTQVSRPRWVTPNKMFDYMFAGIPTIVNFAGTAAEIVESDGVGVASKPGDAADLAARIRYYADHPDARRQVGQHAREVARSKYDRASIARQMSALLDEVIKRHKQGGGR